VRSAASQPRLTPEQTRELLVQTGTPQAQQLDRLIGPLPNVRAAILESRGGPPSLKWLPAVISILLGD
jgi:hypothetical protein